MKNWWLVLAMLACQRPEPPVPLFDCRVADVSRVKARLGGRWSAANVSAPRTLAELAALGDGKRHRFVVLADGKLLVALPPH